MKKLYTIAVAIASFCLGTPVLIAQCNPLLRGPVVINEFLPANISVATNAIGEFHDYIELYNTSNTPFNMNGYFLSDSRGSNGRTKFQFPDVTVPPNGYLIVWCDGVGDPFMPGLNANFALGSTEGELVVLSNPDSVIVDYARFAAIEDNVSIGRFPNGTGPFTRMVPSFNGPNFNGESLNISINEYMASNSTVASDANGDFNDWIELYNNSNTPVNMTGWMLSDDHNSPSKLTFPSGTMLQPGEYLIVWADNEPLQGPLHAEFALSAMGEEVILSRPDTSTVDFFAYGQQLTDVSEGRFPNGIGGLIPCMAPTFAASNSGTLSAIESLPQTKWMLYPNPAKEWIEISEAFDRNTPYEVYSLQGRLLQNGFLRAGEMRIDLSGMNSGIYMLRLANESQLFVVYK